MNFQKKKQQNLTNWSVIACVSHVAFRKFPLALLLYHLGGFSVIYPVHDWRVFTAPTKTLVNR